MEEIESRFFSAAASTALLYGEQQIAAPAKIKRAADSIPLPFVMNKEIDGYRCGPSYGSTFRKSERIVRSSGVNIFW